MIAQSRAMKFFFMHFLFLFFKYQNAFVIKFLFFLRRKLITEILLFFFSSCSFHQQHHQHQFFSHKKNHDQNSKSENPVRWQTQLKWMKRNLRRMLIQAAAADRSGSRKRYRFLTFSQQKFWWRNWRKNARVKMMSFENLQMSDEKVYTKHIENKIEKKQCCCWMFYFTFIERTRCATVTVQC